MSKQSWLNSSSYNPRVIKKNIRVPESVPATTKEKRDYDQETNLPPVINEHVFQKTLPVLQRFLEPTAPFIELDPDRMLLVTLTTMILMAQGKDIPQGNRSWTKNYLKCIRDRNGKVPHNIKIIMETLNEQ